MSCLRVDTSQLRSEILGGPHIPGHRDASHYACCSAMGQAAGEVLCWTDLERLHLSSGLCISLPVNKHDR